MALSNTLLDDAHPTINCVSYSKGGVTDVATHRIYGRDGMRVVPGLDGPAQDQKKGQFRGGFGGLMANPADLLGIAEVQKELSVSDEQKGLIEDMVAIWASSGAACSPLPGFQNLSQDEQRKRREEAGKKMKNSARKQTRWSR